MCPAFAGYKDHKDNAVIIVLKDSLGTWQEQTITSWHRVHSDRAGLGSPALWVPISLHPF